MTNKPLEEWTFDELVAHCTELQINAIVRGEPIGRIVSTICQEAAAWRYEKSKAASAPKPKYDLDEMNKDETRPLVITPTASHSGGRKGSMNGIWRAHIEGILGFASNGNVDPDKVEYTWNFKYKKANFSIWDYKGSGRDGVWSFSGDAGLLKEIFPMAGFSD